MFHYNGSPSWWIKLTVNGGFTITLSHIAIAILFLIDHAALVQRKVDSFTEHQ